MVGRYLPTNPPQENVSIRSPPVLNEFIYSIILLLERELAWKAIIHYSKNNCDHSLWPRLALHILLDLHLKLLFVILGKQWKSYRMLINDLLRLLFYLYHDEKVWVITYGSSYYRELYTLRCASLSLCSCWHKAHVWRWYNIMRLSFSYRSTKVLYEHIMIRYSKQWCFIKWPAPPVGGAPPRRGGGPH